MIRIAVLGDIGSGKSFLQTLKIPLFVQMSVQSLYSTSRSYSL